MIQRDCEKTHMYRREESLKFNYTLWAENNPRTRSSGYHRPCINPARPRPPNIRYTVSALRAARCSNIHLVSAYFEWPRAVRNITSEPVSNYGRQIDLINRKFSNLRLAQ